MEKEGELEETSMAMAGAVAGPASKKKKNDDDELIEKVLHYLLTRGAVK